MDLLLVRVGEEGLGDGKLAEGREFVVGPEVERVCARLLLPG